MKDRIIDFLASQESSQDVVSVAQHIYNKKDVSDEQCNVVGRIMYQLHKQGVLGMLQGCAPYSLSSYFIKED